MRDQTDSTILLTALGVDLEGNKEVLADAVRVQKRARMGGWTCSKICGHEEPHRWISLSPMDTTDCSQLFRPSLQPPCANAAWCINSGVLMNAIPKRERTAVATELAGIWKSVTKEEALTQLAAFKGKYQKRYPEAVRSLMEEEEHLLTFYAFPQVMHRYIRTTNAIESFFSNVRQRTDQIDAFTTETSCLTIVWAVMQDIRLPKIPVGL
jgi:transposase-like protein